VSQLDAQFGHAARFLDIVGMELLRFQPYEIAIMMNIIVANASILTNLSAYHMIGDYYAVLPGAIKELFITVADKYDQMIGKPGVLVKALVAAQPGHRIAVVHGAGGEDDRPGFDRTDPLDHRAHVGHELVGGRPAWSFMPSSTETMVGFQAAMS
jgi:hypothetical protein